MGEIDELAQSNVCASVYEWVIETPQYKGTAQRQQQQRRRQGNQRDEGKSGSWDSQFINLPTHVPGIDREREREREIQLISHSLLLSDQRRA